MWCPIATSILAVVVAIVAAIVAALKWRYKYYWQSQQVPHIPATFPGGNINLLHLEESISIVFKKWYNEFKSKGHKYGGTFVLTSPILTIVDLELIKMILLKDFSNFMDRGFYYNDKDDPLSGNLLNLEGQRWRTLRNKLSPTFTSGKLKMMFPILVECSSRLDDPITLAVENKEPIDAKDVFIRFTTDVIGSCIFGIDCNSFKNKENPFALYAKKIFEPTLIENLRSLLIFGCPSLARFFRMRVTPPDVAKFFWKLTDDAVTHRENNNITRNDFLQLLIDMKNDTKGGDTLTMGEIAAQGFIFFLGGYETSSTTGSFCLYELSVHQDVQRKLRKEIEEVLEKHEGKITYEAMQQMTYMEQVINGEFQRLDDAIKYTRLFFYYRNSEEVPAYIKLKQSLSEGLSDTGK